MQHRIAVCIYIYLYIYILLLHYCSICVGAKDDGIHVSYIQYADASVLSALRSKICCHLALWIHHPRHRGLHCDFEYHKVLWMENVNKHDSSYISK